METDIEIGQIVNTYGIKGFLKVVPFTDDITRFEKLDFLFVEQNKQREEFEIEEVRYNKGLVLLKLKGIDTIEAAERLKNAFLIIDRKNAVSLPEDTYFIVDLIGLEVITDQQERLGAIIDIFPTGSNDIYVVKDEMGKQILLPAIQDVIKQVDIPNKKMIVHLLEGLR